MKFFFFTSILSFSTLIACLKVNACDCIVVPLKQSISYHNCIITGSFVQGDRLWEISEMNNNINSAKLYYTGKFIISKVIKGTGIKCGDTITISSDYSNCSMLFKTNSAYLLFSNENENKLFFSICSYSGLLNNKRNRKVLKQTEQLMKHVSADMQSSY